MFKNVLNKAKELGGKVDVKGSIESAKNTTAGSLTETKSKVGGIMESNWPKVETVIYEGLLGVAEGKLQDDAALASAFDKVYEMLPMPIRLVVSRVKFIDFCMTKKEPIVAKFSTYRSSKIEALSIAKSKEVESV